MKHLVILFMLFFTGCNSLHEQYVNADAATYEYAQPKLEEWAEMKAAQGDAEWVPIVDDKGTSWKARIDRAKKSLED